MSTILTYAATVAICFVFVYLWFVYKRSRAPDYDPNEGVARAVDDHIDVEALRDDPAKLEALRDQVSFVGFETRPFKELGTRAESWFVDSNGAIVTLQTTFEGPGAVDPDTSRTLGLFRDRSFPKRVDERNKRIEANARWLADALDVPFEG